MAEFSGYLRALRTNDTIAKVYIPNQGFTDAKITELKGDLAVVTPTAGTSEYVMSAETIIIQQAK